MLELLTKHWNKIDCLRSHLEVARRWTKHKDLLTEASAKVWLQLEEQLNNKLQKLEDKFWELNVPDIEEQANCESSKESPTQVRGRAEKRTSQTC